MWGQEIEHTFQRGRERENWFLGVLELQHTFLVVGRLDQRDMAGILCASYPSPCRMEHVFFSFLGADPRGRGGQEIFVAQEGACRIPHAPLHLLMSKD